MVTMMVMAACAAHAVRAEHAELPDLVVTPTGQAVPAMRLGHSISTITAAQIEANGWRTLPEALRMVPGLHLNQSGAPGSTVGIVIRGSRSSQVLVLVDGVRLNDPSGPTREADIAAIDLANVERIEIMRGPQSGLYGSDAIAGVIHIITKRPAKGFTSSVFAEAGSYSTFRVGGILHTGSEKTTAAASVSYLKSDGFSSANTRFPGNEEDDGVESLNIAASIGHQVSDALHIDGRVQVLDAETEYDNGGGPGADALGNVAQTEQVLVGLRAMTGAADAAWRQTLALNYSTFDREFDDAWGGISYKGDTIETDWRHDIRLGRGHILTTGVNYREENAKSGGDRRVSADNVAVYLQDSASCAAFDAVAGLRYDQHESFGGELTWRLAPSYRIEKTGTRIKGSLGTGFKAPSLYQLYAPDSAWGPVGNAGLDPETSLGLDAGIEQALFSKTLVLGLTYFASRVEDQIDFAVGYQNTSRVDNEGVEIFAAWTPVDAFSLMVAYTRTAAEDKDTGVQLIRIPKDRASLTASADLGRRLHFSGTVLYTGAFDDRYFDSTMFIPVDARVSSSVVVNLAASFALSERIRLYGRIDNLFDEAYEEVYGYGTAGVSGYGGVKINL